MRTRFIWTEDRIQTALAMRRKGKTNAQIGWVLEVSGRSVSDRLRRLGYGQAERPVERRAVAKADPGPVENEFTIRTARETQVQACERHAAAVMAEGGFCAFSDSGDKRSPFGIARPLVWPGMRRAA